ncbi:MAG: ABC transporter ATP-binding protein [Microbacterium gubbeenense]|uniref:ABC transporter ATP-binding protein n=1 Tax=Microbacterium gubbeenense TaxID=159896 RepID=UPI00041002A7|nr:ABC transporter ATP-binding protein [Microbacterium gubbeenense]
MSLLSVSDLTIRADEKILVDRLSFDLDEGERIGLIGESGSGKSLTTLAIMGLLPPGLTAEGSIVLDGTEIVGARERTLNRIRGRAAAPVFQEPRTALDPLMRVGAQIAEPLRRRGARGSALKRAVGDLLAQVALADENRISRAFPHELSGGQRQRIAIAIALAAEPKVLLADEPTTALDVSVQAEVLALIDEIATAREMSVVFVSHDLAVVSQVASRALVMRRGEVVERGEVGAMLAFPQHDYTAGLIASAKRFEDALERRMGS